MPVFQLTHANGRIYEVEAPDEDSARHVLNAAAAPAPPAIQPAAVAPPAAPEAEAPAGPPDMDQLLRDVQAGKARFSHYPHAYQLEMARRYDANRLGAAKFGDRLTNSLLMNWGDEASAALNAGAETLGLTKAYAGKTFGERYEDYQAFHDAQLRAYAIDNPKTAIAADILGAAASGIATGSLGLGARALGTGAGMAKVVGGSMVDGTLAGAIYGAGDGTTPEDRGTNAIVGAGLGLAGGAAAPYIGKGFEKTIGAFRPAVKVPTQAELQAAANSAEARMRDAGVSLSPQATTRLNDGLTTYIAERGYGVNPSADVTRIRDTVKGMAGKEAPLPDIYALRGMARGAYIGAEKPTEATRRTMRRLTTDIDEIVNRPVAGDILAGDSKAGAAAFNQRQQADDTLRKLQQVKDIAKGAEVDAATSNAGATLYETQREQIKPLLKPGAPTYGFTRDEREAARLAGYGPTLANVAHKAAKAVKGDIPAWVTPAIGGVVGGVVGGPVASVLGGLGPPALRYAANKAADYSAQNAMRNWERIVAAGGQKAAITLQPNVWQRGVTSDAARQAYANMLLEQLIGPMRKAFAPEAPAAAR